MFTSEVQFGHAGSLAGSALEKAAAKNKALAAYGAVVPDSFDTLGAAVKKVTHARTHADARTHSRIRTDVHIYAPTLVCVCTGQKMNRRNVRSKRTRKVHQIE